MNDRIRLGRVLLLLALAAILLAIFSSGLLDQLRLETLKARRDELQALVAARPLLVAGVFFLLYVAMSSLSIPGAAIASLAAGALFGLAAGSAIVLTAATIGACFSFLAARYLLRDWVRRRFGPRLGAIDRGIEKDGAFYLLTLRLNPAFPYVLVNLAMGLTRMRLAPYAAVSWIGMLPGTLVYVNAGTQLARIESPSDVASPGVIGALLLLSLFPLLAKLLADRLRRRRAYRGWARPRRFDRNLIVIGAGAGGLVTAYIAAAVRAKATLIEAREMGGDCLNTGCVPSKTLISAARDRAPFGQAMERVFAAIERIAPNDSAERYRGLGVDVRRGHAKLVDPWTVEIDGGERLTARAIVIAAGGEPAVPDIPGLPQSGYLTSDTMWAALAGRERAPERLAILGGGPVGTELAQAFARLGSRVTQIEQGPRLLPKEDGEASAVIEARLRAEGVEVRTNTELLRVDGKALILREEAIPFDLLIVAVGRRARLTGYGLEELGIETGPTIAVNDFLETRYPNIYAVGDVAGPHRFTHFAAHQAWFATVNALFGSFRRFRADWRVLPRVTFTDPEVAHVGHNAESAQAAGIPHEVVRYDLAHLDRAVCEGAAEGFVKILVAPGKDRILGATIVGLHAGEWLAEIVLAMKHNIGLNKILGTVHAYPTMAEANKYAAGEWRKRHQPERLLRLAELYHAWRRG